MGKMPAKRKSKKVTVTVKECTAAALGMSVDEAVDKVNAILKKHKIKPASFLSVLFEEGKALICTTVATIECNRKMTTSELRAPNVGYTVGRNATGHKLPACSSGSFA